MKFGAFRGIMGNETFSTVAKTAETPRFGRKLGDFADSGDFAARAFVPSFRGDGRVGENAALSFLVCPYIN